MSLVTTCSCWQSMHPTVLLSSSHCCSEYSPAKWLVFELKRSRQSSSTLKSSWCSSWQIGCKASKPHRNSLSCWLRHPFLMNSKRKPKTTICWRHDIGCKVGIRVWWTTENSAFPGKEDSAFSILWLLWLLLTRLRRDSRLVGHILQNAWRSWRFD